MHLFSKVFTLNIEIPLMKITLHSQKISVFCLSLVLFSCSKEINAVVFQPQRAPVSLTESARVWYLEHRQAKATTTENDMLMQYWEKAQILQTADGHALLVVPLPDPPVSNKALAFRRYLVFEPSGNNIANGKIVELLGDKFNVENQSDLLLTGRAASTIPGFNGSILQYDVNYKSIENASYANGNKKLNTQSFVIKFSGRDLNSPLREGLGNQPISLLQTGRYPIGKTIYSVKAMAPYKTLLVQDNDSLIFDFMRYPGMHGKPEGIKPSGNQTIAGAFKAVLGNNGIQQLSPTENGNLLIKLYCKPDAGRAKIAAVEFIFFHPDNNGLTLNEIDKLTAYMKSHITFDLLSNADAEKDLIWSMAQLVRLPPATVVSKVD